jgi:hypothetical protein
MTRAIDELIDGELERFGVPSKYVKRIPGGRHMRLVIKGRTKEGYMPYSLGCSGRGLLNFRTEFRRFLGGLGFTPTVRRVGSFGAALLDAAVQTTSPTADALLTNACETQASPRGEEMPYVTPELLAQTTTLEPNPKDKPMTEIETPTRSMLNQGEVAQVTMLISQNASVDFAKKIVTYYTGWNDERIHKMVAVGDRKHLTVDSIAKFRKSFFGSTKEEINKRGEAQAGGNFAAMWRAVHNLQERVEALEAAATEPKTKSSNGTHPHTSSN